MTDSRQSPGRFSSATRITAILAAMTPVVVGIYQEAQEASQRRKQTQLEQRSAAATQQRLAEQSDANTADLLRKAFLAAHATPDTAGDGKTADGGIGDFCSNLYYATAQLNMAKDARLHMAGNSPRTLTLLTAAFKYQRQDGSRLVCACSTGSAARASWFDAFNFFSDSPATAAADGKEIIRGFVDVLRNAKAVCDEAEKAGQPEPGGAAKTTAVEQCLADQAALRLELSALKKTCPLPDKALPDAVPTVGNPPATPKSSCTVTPPDGASTRLRVFIQVPDEPAKAEAERFHAALNEKSALPFKSPSIEVVGQARSPSSLQIRFTYEADRVAAEKLKDALDGGRCVGRQRAALVPMPRMQGRTDPGVLEVWWPRSPSTGATR